MSWKISLVILEILGLFINILTANDKYSFLLTDKSLLPMKMQLSLKQNIFSQFCPSILKPTSNSEHFETQDDPP